MDWQTFLISQKGWRDDEGLRCGGMHRPIPVSLAAVKEALLGCRKDALWQMVENDLEGAGIDVRREIDGRTDS